MDKIHFIICGKLIEYCWFDDRFWHHSVGERKKCIEEGKNYDESMVKR